VVAHRVEGAAAEDDGRARDALAVLPNVGLDVGPRHLAVPADGSVLRERRDADELHGRPTSAGDKTGRAGGGEDGKRRDESAALLPEPEEVERIAVVVVVGLLVDDAGGRHVLDREAGGVEDGDAVDAGAAPALSPSLPVPVRPGRLPTTISPIRRRCRRRSEALRRRGR